MNNSNFEDFVNSKHNSPSQKLDQNILDMVQKDLNPTHTLVFLKLLSIQAFIGGLTLLFCPQFEMSITNNYDLFHFFHRTFGHYSCMAVCGSLFIGSGAVFASYIMTLSEIQKVRESKFLYYIAISGITVLVFLFLGANIFLDLTAIWFVGAVLSGVITLEANRIIRSKLISSH